MFGGVSFLRALSIGLAWQLPCVCTAAVLRGTVGTGTLKGSKRNTRMKYFILCLTFKSSKFLLFLKWRVQKVLSVTFLWFFSIYIWNDTALGKESECLLQMSASEHWDSSSDLVASSCLVNVLCWAGHVLLDLSLGLGVVLVPVNYHLAVKYFILIK